MSGVWRDTGGSAQNKVDIMIAGRAGRVIKRQEGFGGRERALGASEAPRGLREGCESSAREGAMAGGQQGGMLGAGTD